MKHLHLGTVQNKCGDLIDKMAKSPFGHRAKDCCVGSLIQLLRKWPCLHLGAEPKTFLPSLIQLLGKQQRCHLRRETKAKRCDITDTVLMKMSTSTFGNRAQDVGHVKCRQKMAKI